MGFTADGRTHSEIEAEKALILRDATHDDLLTYGLIPEFVGRLPVVSTLDPLDLDVMVQILTRPKNAVARQFERLFALDGIELSFTEDALTAIAERALEQRTGARGLRTVVEELLLDVMYETPSRPEVKKCVVSGEHVLQRRRPLLISESGQVLDDDAEETDEQASA
jgi:ATP-dependent Clp protease ATP-binding subunit ClpX